MSIRKKVIEAYQKISPATVKDVAEYTKLEYKQVSGAVTQLAEQGKLKRVDRGTYIYVWDKSEKPSVISNTLMSDEEAVDEPLEEYLPSLNQFIIDHGIDEDTLHQIELLTEYYERYVAE